MFEKSLFTENIAKPKEPESQVIESIAVLTAKTAVEEFGEL